MIGIRLPFLARRSGLAGALGLALIGGLAGLAGMAALARGGPIPPIPPIPAAAPPAASPPSAPAEPLAGLGIAVTGGAAPGYVPDRVCGTCHADLARSYGEVAMARSFYRPGAAPPIEDFAAPPFAHGPSGQVFQMTRSGGRLVFRRWLAGAGPTAGIPAIPPTPPTPPTPPNTAPGAPAGRGAGGPDGQVFETEVEWILGSGNHARTYLYRTPDGALFQLPLAWYTQEGRWGMAPGYDRPDHGGVLRRVTRECLFCHNAYPDVPAGSDAEGAPHLFPAVLPAGVGCQRCHGPGAEHVRRALGGVEPRPEIRAAIVNPARLAPALRDDVCFQCHLQPAVALSGARRLGRGDYSFRPGEPLPDYQAHVDISEEGTAGTGAGDRFEINHHAHRLRRSRCFTASAGQLSCLTCHDPHRTVPAAERAGHFRAACLTCHQEERLRASHPPVAGVPPAAAAPTTDGPGKRDLDCVSCHMPKRRPRDVVHVVMTDHLIRRRPGGPELLAPLAESEPVLTGIELLEPGRLPAGERELYRTLPVARTGVSPDALTHLEKLVGAGADPGLKLELALAELRRRRYAEAERLLAGWSAEARDGRVLQALGTAWEGLGRAAEAESAFRAALARPDVDRPEVAARLGQLLGRLGRHREAAEVLAVAVAERPNLVAAWYRLGEAQAALGRKKDAAASFRRALAIDPAAAPVARALEALER
jgi:Tetratricopeptide repeat